MEIMPIAHIKSELPSKFGIPRQSGLVKGLRATIVFDGEYRNPEALRGLEEFSYIWLIWGFSENKQEGFTPTVRPPRLGGNVRMGVFATRSPFRPNSLGLSSVEIESVENHETLGTVINVLGADLMDGTPIYDIKPYVPYADSHPEALGGFAGAAPKKLQVVIEECCGPRLTEETWAVLTDLLSQDPRPRYQDDPSRVYGMEFREYEVKFSVEGDVLTVRDVTGRQGS